MTTKQPEPNPDVDPVGSAGDSGDAEMFSPEDWALLDGIQGPVPRPLSPPKRELPPEDENEQHDT
jgi:hypothetical protein